MRFLLFAVVLILPAFEGEGASSGIDKCQLALMNKKGDIYCEISGYDNFNSWIFKTCELACGGAMVQLPNEACPNGTMHNPCTEEELHHLQNWAKTLETKKAKIKEKWCNA
uniref:Putative ixodes 10 kDa peptide protein n=1 Tax=Ixodes ricinus TaxID=34613 RepID=A0A0K8R6F0_IXORI